MLPKRTGRTGGVPLSGGLASAWHQLQMKKYFDHIITD
jgi:hypothetical protein